MITLNLASPDKSDIGFSINNYPDGQRDLNLLDKGDLTLDFLEQHTPAVLIKSRFNSVADLNLIKVANKCLRRLGIKKVSLYIPYLHGARADRKFVKGGCSYLVDVIAPDLKRLKFKSITVLDVHSEVSPAVLTNMINESVLPKLTELALLEASKQNTEHCYVISPDAGASKRTFETAKNVSGYKIDIVECAKHRDLASGKILQTIVPHEDFNKESEVMVDDICSKGGTFMGIASELNKKNAGDIYLVVAHFEGTADLAALKAAGIKKVFTTNSIKDITTEDGFVHQIDVF